ncbi:WD repeat-containing protein 25, partial [Linnemannia elongata]
FLCDRVRLNRDFEQQLRAVIDQSKTDSNATIAATNAITILVRAGVAFHGADLRGIKIPHADLSEGQFDSAQFQGADLTGVNLSRSWLRQADLSHTQLKGVQFGELPYLKVKGEAQACAYSQDGRMLGVALWAKGLGISIFDTSTWQRIHLITATQKVNSVAFSPDSQRIVSGDQKGMVQLWDCTSGEELLIMKGHTDSIRSLAYSPWDSETGKPGVVLSPSLGEIYSLAISPDGRWVASGHFNGNVRLWDMTSSRPGPVLQGHTERVTGITFSPNGQLIVTSSWDRGVQLWDVSTGDLTSRFDGHSMIASDIDVAFSPDGLTIASGSGDKTVRLWEVNSSRSNIALQDQIDNALRVAYSPDGLSILSIDRLTFLFFDYPGVIRQGDATTGLRGSVLFELPDITSIKELAVSPDGNQIAAGCKDGSVRLWDSSNGVAGPVLQGHSSAVKILAYSTCGRWMTSSDDDGIVRLWDLHDTEQRYVLVETGTGYGKRISGLKFSPTGHQLAACSEEGTVRLFDPRTRGLLTSKKLTEARILALDYSPNGQQLALGTLCSIALWDLRSDEPHWEMEVPPNSCENAFGHGVTVAYSPCGQFLASSSVDYIVHLWLRHSTKGDIEHWSCAFKLRVFHDFVTSLSWNPVLATEFITASRDGSVRVWRVSSDNGTVTVRMLWGTNLRRLCTAGAVFEGATGLSPIHQNLLAQRSSFDRGLSSDDSGSDDESEDDNWCDIWSEDEE